MSIRKQYELLAKKYGQYASWAIWDEKDESDPKIIQSHIKDLNSKYVFIALNASGDFRREGPWANFRGGKHDRKLKFACNDTALRGSYLTDLFKGVKEADSKEVQKHLTDEFMKQSVSQFCEEMLDIGATKNTVYIVLGTPTSVLGKSFKAHFLVPLASKNVVYYNHYSNYRLTDKEWVEGLWKKLGVRASYHKIRKKY